MTFTGLDFRNTSYSRKSTESTAGLNISKSRYKEEFQPFNASFCNAGLIIDPLILPDLHLRPTKAGKKYQKTSTGLYSSTMYSPSDNLSNIHSIKDILNPPRRQKILSPFASLDEGRSIVKNEYCIKQKITESSVEDLGVINI